MKYYCHDNFEKLPIGAWDLLLDKALVNATHLEVSRTFSKVPLAAAFIDASVPLPQHIPRVYSFTHRFLLTPEVVAEVRSRRYQNWDWGKCDSEDPAFYEENVLLLGTISHEDIVIMLMDENSRSELNSQGFEFWCEFDLNT